MINRKINTFIPELYPKNERINMNSLESGSNVQSGLEMIMEKSPDTIVLVDRNLTLVKVISRITVSESNLKRCSRTGRTTINMRSIELRLNVFSRSK